MQAQALALESIESPQARRAAARSRLYAVFADFFEYPDAEREGELRSGEAARVLSEALAAVDPELAEGLDETALGSAGDEPDALAIEYTRLFDVGTGGPPCPLYGGVYGGARMKTMEEAVRFYNHFGLSLAESPRELPDHLTTELEFLHFLAFREAAAWLAAEDPQPYQRAARDFAARHPGRFVSKLGERLARHEALGFFRELARQLERFLAWDVARLTDEVGSAPQQATASQVRNVRGSAPKAPPSA